MMLTTKGRYAVMALLDMASHYNGNPISLSEISERLSIPINYLEQIFAKLKKASVVKSMRGPGGGYLLNKSTHDITIDQIIDAVEEKIDMTRCKSLKNAGCMPLGIKCKTHDLWAGLGNKIREYFSGLSIQNVLDGRVLDAISRS